MPIEAAMKHVGEIDGYPIYFAAAGKFEKPGIYFWDGTSNVHVPIPLAQPTDRKDGGSDQQPKRETRKAGTNNDSPRSVTGGGALPHITGMPPLGNIEAQHSIATSHPTGDAEGLVERLRDDRYHGSAMCLEAATMIEALNSRLATAVEGFKKSRKQSTLASNEDQVRFEIYNGDLLLTEAASELLRVERAQHEAERFRHRDTQAALGVAKARVVVLEKALEPFAALTEGCNHFEKADDEYVCAFHIQGKRVAATVGQCRQASAALSTGAGEDRKS